MRLIEGYLFRQLLVPTLAAAVALGGVAVLSQSLSSLDLLVDQRQSIVVFGRVVLLSLPELLALVLPVAVFVAALMALNRLHIEQEIVICFAAGMSRWKVIAPAVKLATLAALLTLVVNLWVEPWCAREMRKEPLHLPGAARRDLHHLHRAEGHHHQAQRPAGDGDAERLERGLQCGGGAELPSLRRVHPGPRTLRQHRGEAALQDRRPLSA
jgi:hypothetical protein